MDFDQSLPSKRNPFILSWGRLWYWVVRQARHDPSRNYVTVELRADRVAQIFSKATLDGIKQNVPLGSGVASSAIASKKDPFSTVFANFPEPPTQSFGGWQWWNSKSQS
jgi:hypothetical protein